MELNNTSKSEEQKFYSDKVIITKKFLTENNLKLIYQKRSISNLDSKHKYWSQHIGY